MTVKKTLSLSCFKLSYLRTQVTREFLLELEMCVLVAPVCPSFLCQSGGSDHLPPSWADHLPPSCILLVHLSPFPMPICLLPIAAIPPTLWSSSSGIHRGPSVFWLLAFCSVCTTGHDKLASSLDLFLPASSVSHEVTATNAFPRLLLN